MLHKSFPASVNLTETGSHPEKIRLLQNIMSKHFDFVSLYDLKRTFIEIKTIS